MIRSSLRFPRSLLSTAALVCLASTTACGDDASSEDSEAETGEAGEAGEAGETGSTGGEENTLPDTDPDCHEETFLDPAAFEDPEGTDLAPEYSIACAGGTMTVASNGVPHYDFVQTTPNDLAAAPREHEIPLEPTWIDTPIYSTTLWRVGVAVNGTNLQTPSEAADLGFGDPVYDMALDYCNGHTGFGGEYHNHAMVGTCYFSSDDGSRPSPILGWAYDGYPIYGAMGCLDTACDTPVEMLSSYTQLNDPTDCVDQSFEYSGDADEHSDGDAYLDECNGHFGPEGDYHYHTTSTYPYILGCFHGQPGPSALAYGSGMEDALMEESCTDGECTGQACGMMPGMP